MYLGGDKISHFTGSETGGIDGAPGDQTRRESRIQNYYCGSWDDVLHYNGKTDVGVAPGGSGSGAPSGDMPELAESIDDGLTGRNHLVADVPLFLKRVALGRA